MTLKQLREKKARLEAEARAKLTSITDQTTPEQARAIESEHADLLSQIAAVAEEIRAVDGDVDDESGMSAKKRKRAKKKDTEGDGDEAGEDEDDDSTNENGEGEDDDSTDAEDQEDDDGNDDSGKKRKRKVGLKRKRKEKDGEDYDRSEIAEMAMIDSQARGLGIDLNFAEAISNGESPDRMRKRLFEKLAERSRNNGPLSSLGPHLEVLNDERGEKAKAMEVALIARILGSRDPKERIDVTDKAYRPKNAELQRQVDQYRDQARQYLGMGFVEIAAECIGYRGNIRNAATADNILKRAFESTSDFPSIFENVLNKSLLARYELHMPTYRELAIERPFNDFRPHPQIRAGEFPQLQPVSETGELKYGTSADDGENVSVYPYGVVFTISRQMLVNDDLGAIDQILGSAGDTVLVFENTTFFTMFNSNPTLTQDGYAVFSSQHNNLVSSGNGAAPTLSTIAAARQSLRQMKSLTGLYLNVPPRIILTGPAQETAADQMVTAITPTLTTSVNPFSGRLRSVSDANITTTQWYVLAEPGRVPCFVYGFLNGASGPRVRTFEPFGVQGVKVSLEHDFGCGAIDYRGFYENYGS